MQLTLDIDGLRASFQFGAFLVQHNLESDFESDIYDSQSMHVKLLSGHVKVAMWKSTRLETLKEKMWGMLGTTIWPLL